MAIPIGSGKLNQADIWFIYLGYNIIFHFLKYRLVKIWK